MPPGCALMLASQTGPPLLAAGRGWGRVSRADGIAPGAGIAFLWRIVGALPQAARAAAAQHIAAATVSVGIIELFIVDVFGLVIAAICHALIPFLARLGSRHHAQGRLALPSA